MYKKKKKKKKKNLILKNSLQDRNCINNNYDHFDSNDNFLKL